MCGGTWCGDSSIVFSGLVPRPPLQKPPSRGLEGSGGEGGGGDEGLKVEGGFTFGRLQRGLKGASRGLEGGFKGAWRGLQRGFTLKGASRGLQGGMKGAWSPLQAPLKPPWSILEAPFSAEGFKPPSSPLKPPSRWSTLEAPFKPPSSSLQASSKPPSALKASSPLEAPLKPPSSPLEAPSSPSPLQVPSSPLEGRAKTTSEIPSNTTSQQQIGNQPVSEEICLCLLLHDLSLSSPVSVKGHWTCTCDSCHFALCIQMSLNYGLSVSLRSVAVCEEKKTVSEEIWGFCPKRGDTRLNVKSAWSKCHWVCTRHEVTYWWRMQGRKVGRGKCKLNSNWFMVTSSEWNCQRARKWRAHAQLNHHWSWWEESETAAGVSESSQQVSFRAIVRVLVRGSNYGTNSSRTVTTSCNPKDS